MSDIHYTPTFRHTDWIDNVDRIVAGGPTGFNVRLNAIQDDLHQLSTVVVALDSALDEIKAAVPVPPPGEQRVAVPLVPFFTGGPALRQGFPFIDTAGELHFTRGTVPDTAVFALTLPERTRITSLRVTGRYPFGAPGSLTVSVARSPLTDVTSPGDTIALVPVSQLVTAPAGPFDLTSPANRTVATVDLNAFRYFVSASGAIGADPATMSIAGIQVGFVAV
ncbi:hypothetical protein [Dactylosporangium sp. CA-092794]|uniref:hypothetical protein n=1 Tax=Dactylosporangium sp. CA-092794 TaxID=3239929 RepID=UPI003D923EAB